MFLPGTALTPYRYQKVKHIVLIHRNTIDSGTKLRWTNFGAGDSALGQSAMVRTVWQTRASSVE